MPPRPHDWLTEDDDTTACARCGEPFDGENAYLLCSAPGKMDERTLAASLVGRAKALDQLAGMVARLPAWRARTREQRDYLAGELRLEATRARTDLAQARRPRLTTQGSIRPSWMED